MAQTQASPLFCLLTPLLHSLRASATAAMRSPLSRQAVLSSQCRQFTSTPSFLAVPRPNQAPRGNQGRRGKDLRKPKDRRVQLIRYFLQHPMTPRPLRFSRMRSLRHWTIHRAWMLFRRKKRAAEEQELYRMYQSMQGACEELRKLEGPNVSKGSRLYRIAMEKKGIFRQGGVPIEYGRAQTETPAIEAWNHGWKR